MTTLFIAGNALEKALVLAADDAAARPAFYRTLLESQLFFLTPPHPDGEGTRVLGSGEQVQLVQWRGSAGAFVPIFSSRARAVELAAQTGVELGCLAITGRDALQLLAQRPTDAILNPGLDYGKQFVPEEIQQLAAAARS